MKNELHKYITGIIESKKHKMLQINSMPDHIHILAGIHPAESISSCVQHIKTESSKWIKTKAFCNTPFSWQDGYGAFSYSKSHVPQVIRYIQNQEAHHKKQTFPDEYKHFLEAFNIEYNEAYIFKAPE